MGPTIPFVTGVSYMLPASAPGGFTESLNWSSNRILDSGILNDAIKCLCINVIRTLAGEKLSENGKEHHTGDPQAGYNYCRVAGCFCVLLNFLADGTYIRGNLAWAI